MARYRHWLAHISKWGFLAGALLVLMWVNKALAAASSVAVESVACIVSSTPTFRSCDSSDLSPGDVIRIGIINLGTTSVFPSVPDLSIAGDTAYVIENAKPDNRGLPPGVRSVIQLTVVRATAGACLLVTVNWRHSGNGSPLVAPVRFGSCGPGTIGSSPANPARSACVLRDARPTLASGVYWFDPDGSGANPPFQTYADLATAGGCWIQVRRVAGVGGWYPLNDDLRGTTPYNAAFSSTINSSTHWSLKFDYFVDAETEYLFATGDSAVWCVIRRGLNNFDGVTSETNRATTVINSSGTTVSAGGVTNVLLRTNAEDPWIGCEGSHSANQQKMLYGEAGAIFLPHVNLKNNVTQNGINIFVREPRAPKIVIDPSVISFGNVETYTTSNARVVTIRNTGNTTLTIRGIALVGTDSDQFLQKNNCSTISAGASCTIEVKCSPTSPRPIAASISVEHNATGSPVAVRLVCDGVAPPNLGSTQMLSIECAPYGRSKFTAAQCALKPMAGDKIRIAFKNTGTNVLTSNYLPLLSGPGGTYVFLSSYPRS
ncbi:MAG: choice-of-anchor D domain-containing protein, partial [Gammaproteobacteria bacterium]|nr:choice-of-anchor D domain-containing protein [Gammaproteobacteria bacterium]